MLKEFELAPKELEDFLDSKPGWMVLTTLGPDGYPHSVPMGYFRLGEDFYLGCRAPTRKTRNIERDARVSLLLENGRRAVSPEGGRKGGRMVSPEGGRPLIGVMVQGDAELIIDPCAQLELKRSFARSKGEREPDKVAPGIAYIRVTPRRVISWKR